MCDILGHTLIISTNVLLLQSQLIHNGFYEVLANG